MAILNGTEISTKHFTWTPALKSLATDMSDLPVRDFQRIYDDAADHGLLIRSEATGNAAWFGIGDEIRDRDNELLGWKLYPIPEAVRRNPALSGVSITIAND